MTDPQTVPPSPTMQTGEGRFAALTSRLSWRLTIVSLWLGFSLALAIWWLIFGLEQVQRLSFLVQPGNSPAGTEALTESITREIARQHRMLTSEGTTLILLLFAGGAGLLYHVYTESQRAQRLKEFFAAFTHDLKTSLASLRLQAESLEEDLKASGQDRLMRRLLKDTVRLELQLENSLLLASPEDRGRFLMEPLDVSELVQTMQHHWPELAVEVQGGGHVHGDRRAVESILKNLLQNSVVHGRATSARVQISANGGGFVTIQIVDNGRGFQGDLKRLGRMFARHGSSSGSGLGLFLASSLAERLEGDVKVLPSAVGFAVEVRLPERSPEAR